MRERMQTNWMHGASHFVGLFGLLGSAAVSLCVAILTLALGQVVGVFPNPPEVWALFVIGVEGFALFLLLGSRMQTLADKIEKAANRKVANRAVPTGNPPDSAEVKSANPTENCYFCGTPLTEASPGRRLCHQCQI